MAVAPRAVVPGPMPTPLQYGLLSILPLRPEESGVWENGVEFYREAFPELEVLGGDGCEPIKIETTSRGVMGEGDAFTVTGYFNCSMLGWSDAEAQEKAAEHLLVAEGVAVERHFWTNIVNSTVDPTLTAMSDPVYALAHLDHEAALEYMEQGTLHMPRSLATILLQKGAVKEQGGRLRTGLGLPVAAGTGYYGAPDDLPEQPDSAYMVAAPPMIAYRSAPFVTTGLRDTGRNDIFALAQRTYVLGFMPYPFLPQLVTLTKE